MSEKRKFPIAVAREVANGLVQLLAPDVQQIIIAGSIRREKPLVSDIELLFIPKTEPRRTGLFDDEQFDLTEQAIENYLRAGVIGKRMRDGSDTYAGWGPKNKLAFHCASGIPVDLFATTPENWFTSLVIRTGGKDTNIALASGAQKLGCSLNAYGSGITNSLGTKIPATSEQHVFHLCGLAYKQPQERA